MEMTLDCFNRVYKTNMTDILDLPVLLKKNASTKYFRELDARAKAKGLHTGKSGIDKDCGIWFDAIINGKRYRYVFVYAFSSHPLDNICVTE